MSDAFALNADVVFAPARRVRAVSPDNDNDLALGPCKALYISVAGTLSIIAADDTDAVSLTVQAGVLPVRVRRVRATGTAATGIVALY
jgi:hypothetical protein